jgi:hypothetical protein
MWTYQEKVAPNEKFKGTKTVQKLNHWTISTLAGITQSTCVCLFLLLFCSQALERYAKHVVQQHMGHMLSWLKFHLAKDA